MVDGGGLENHCTRKGTGGSNPSPSAKATYPLWAWLRGAGVSPNDHQYHYDTIDVGVPEWQMYWCAILMTMS